MGWQDNPEQSRAETYKANYSKIDGCHGQPAQRDESAQARAPEGGLRRAQPFWGKGEDRIVEIYVSVAGQIIHLCLMRQRDACAKRRLRPISPS